MRAISTLALGSCLMLLTAGPLASTATATMTLVESIPAGTTLGHEGMAKSGATWMEMIQGAQKQIHLSHFYAIDDERGSQLGEIIASLEAAAARGVEIRFLLGNKFYESNGYVAVADHLAAIDGIELRRYNVEKAFGTGVLHAKFMTVDGRESFVGSQNFDWRALEHIQELGLRVSNDSITAELDRLFEYDWKLAAGEDRPSHAEEDLPGAAVALDQDRSIQVVASPRQERPEGIDWDLPHLVELMNSAETSIRVQLLSYYATTRDRTYWEPLEVAMRNAAARGVEIKILMSNWAKRKSQVEALLILEKVPHIEVGFLNIPEHAELGHIAFARVAHCKYMVVDGQRAWLGTSNWSRDYFHGSRNVGFILKEPAIGAELDTFFMDGWTSEYAERLDGAKVAEDYRAPKFWEGE